MALKRPEPTALDEIVALGLHELPAIAESRGLRLRAVNELAQLRRKAKSWDERYNRPASMGRGH